jgi:hypothetical protein
MARGVSVGAVALAAVALIFIWSGLHGAAVTGTLRDLLADRGPNRGGVIG